ncbi:phage integrase SAM-like domain-containing protein [Phocaeicola sp.]|uniref:phage integrase SAM-like domain-containing protein n=1 Tax=Phocaeicola sp. TaxID=2773926 RepID=UPI00261E657E|nr:phage integrase SAM-like domain-containing protein [Phocaeicola sp.]
MNRCYVNWVSGYFTDICDENIRAYDEFAKKRCKCQSSVYNYHKILKVFVREAYAAHLISENPYQNFKLDHGKRVARAYPRPSTSTVRMGKTCC